MSPPLLMYATRMVSDMKEYNTDVKTLPSKPRVRSAMSENEITTAL